MKHIFVVASILASATAFGETCNSESVAMLKQQILDISIKNNGDRSNLEGVRAELNPMVAELSKCHTPANAAADLPLLVGAWKEVFSDDVEPEPPGFKIDRDATYQVITNKGYFYNLANQVGFITISGALRGKYEAAGDFLNIEFTKVGARLVGLNDKVSLVDFVEDLESGKARTIGLPGGGKFPNGPVGAKGNIRNLYIDSDFRVATGSNLADGKMDLYVLTRVTTPVRYKNN